MSKSRYQVRQSRFVSTEYGPVWDVLQGERLLKSFNFKSSAEDYAQQLVEDDQWHASNR